MASGRGRSNQVSVGGHQAEGAFGLEAAHRAGAGDLEGLDGEERLEGGHQVEVVGEARQQAVDRPDAELLVDQLDHEAHDGLGPAGGAVGRVGPALVAVGERGLVAVVAVGDDDRLGADGGGDGLDPGRVGDAPHRVHHALGLEVGEGAVVALEQLGEPGGGRQAPHRREVGDGASAAGRAGRSWPSGVVNSWGRMPPSPGRLSSMAPMTPVVWRTTPSSSGPPCGRR